MIKVLKGSVRQIGVVSDNALFLFPVPVSCVLTVSGGLLHKDTNPSVIRKAPPATVSWRGHWDFNTGTLEGHRHFSYSRL